MRTSFRKRETGGERNIYIYNTGFKFVDVLSVNAYNARTIQAGPSF